MIFNCYYDEIQLFAKVTGKVHIGGLMSKINWRKPLVGGGERGGGDEK